MPTTSTDDRIKAIWAEFNEVLNAADRESMAIIMAIKLQTEVINLRLATLEASLARTPRGGGA